MSYFSRGQRRDAIVAACVAVIASFLLFSNGISGPFILDDTIVITGNPLIDGDPGDIFRAFGEPYHFHQPRTGIYRPLTIASYAANWFVFGEDPASFHVINILLHAAVAWTVFVLVSSLSDRKVAYAAMGLFLILPIHVEAVTSIVGRAELLAGLGLMGGLIFALKGRYGLSALVFFAGILAKETALALVPIVLFVELFHKRYSWKMVLGHAAWFVPPLAAYALLRYGALGGEFFLSNDATLVYNPIKFSSFLPGFWTACKVFFLYLQKTLVPFGFSSDYSFNQIPVVHYPWSSAGVLVGLGILGAMTIWMVRSRSSFPGLALAVFLAPYFIVSNWVFKIGTIMGERLMYVPSIGLAMLGGWVFVKILDRIGKPVAYGMAGILLAGYGLQTVRANTLWLDERALFENAYRQSPHSVVARTNQAYLYLIDERIDEARQIIDQALADAPEHAPALNLAGHVLKRQGKLAEAEAVWKRAVSARKDYLRAYLSLGILYYENGYFDSAERVLEDAVVIYPRSHEVLFLALAKIGKEKYDDAISVIVINFGDQPNEKGLRFALGAAHLKKGDRNKAEAYLLQVVPPGMSFPDFVKTVAEGKIFDLGSSIQ